MEEQELVKRSINRDEDAFGRLVEKYKSRVFNMALSITRNPETADDIAQEAFIRAYFGLPRFKFKSSFGTWLYRITMNLVKDHLRKKERTPKLSIEEIKENPFGQEDEVRKREDEKIQEERRVFVHQFIRTLPEKYQVILTLRDIHEFSYGEISNILNISPGTVDSRLHRARRMLRKKIEPYLRRRV
jgi:RNA polymerase sigma-70 factor (ECF subfamily)